MILSLRGSAVETRLTARHPIDFARPGGKRPTIAENMAEDGLALLVDDSHARIGTALSPAPTPPRESRTSPRNAGHTFRLGCGRKRRSSEPDLRW